MKFPKIDASILCFALVVAAAVPVAVLRSRTYAIGYDLGKLKEEERNLRQRNIELQSELAKSQRKVRDKYLTKTQGNNAPAELELPTTQSVLHDRDNERSN